MLISALYASSDEFEGVRSRYQKKWVKMLLQRRMAPEICKLKKVFYDFLEV